MPIPATPLRLGDRGDAVARLHRTFESLNRSIEQGERDRRIFGPATEVVLREYQRQRGFEPQSGEFDVSTRAAMEAMLKDIAPFCVYGKLSDANGEPIAGATIVALDMDLRRSHELRDTPTTTDSGGEYEVRYSANKFARMEKESADLVVRAVLGDEHVAESSILFNAPLEVRVDLRSATGHGPSEYTRLLAVLARIVGDLPLAELNDEDIVFLAGDTRQDGTRIAMLAQAHRMIVPGVPAEALFGLLTQGLPADPAVLSRQSLRTLHTSFERAVQTDTVSAAVGEGRDAYARAVLDLRTRRIIDSATTDDVAPRDPAILDLRARRLVDRATNDDALPRNPWLGQIRTSLGNDRFATFAAVFAEHGDDPETLSAKLTEKGLFQPDEIAQARNVLALKAISHDHAPLHEALEQAATADPRLRNLQALVAFDPSDWSALIATQTTAGGPVGAPHSIPGGTPDQQLANYARLLTAEVEARMPTERFHELAKRDLGNTQRALAPERRQDWVHFLGGNPDFDLRTSKLNELLADPTTRTRRLAGVSDPATLVQDLATLQRVFRLVPAPISLGADRPEGLYATDRYDTVVTLFEAGFESAVSVITVPERVFADKLGKGPGARVVAKHVYMRAAYVGDVALQALLGAHSLTDVSPAFANASDYSTLFGTSDLCECEHCRSFLGPAAYFVDTLQFLSEAGPADNPEAFWNVLAARRPDLGQISLSCANANTELPYLDLVNEVLEEAVAPTKFKRFGLVASAGFDPIAELDAREVTEGLRAAFKQSSNAIELSSGADVYLVEVTETQPRRGKSWFITDRGTLYWVDSSEDPSSLAVVRWASRQTSGTTEELLAAPEHVNTRAYQLLAGGIFPWSLPFDLGWEEIRGLLDQSGLMLHEVATAFEMVGDMPLTPLDALESAPAVREQLGMSEAELNIVQGSRANAVPEAYWDVPSGPTWYVAVAPVAVLIERAGLSYAELLRLLDTHFVNPAKGVGRTLSIVSIDPTAPATCDLTKLVVDGLDAAALDRLHRFVRLWRRLGWTASDLDIVLRALGATDLTAKVLADVSHVERLRLALKLPLDQIAALFADIDAVRYYSHSEDSPRQLPSLYDRVFRFNAGRARADAAFVEQPGLLTGLVDDHVPAIRAALALDQASFTALTAIGGALIGPSPHLLTLANLSNLFRHVLLARSLSLTPQELLRVTTLIGATFAGTPRSVWQVLAAATRLAGTGLALDDLEFILASRPAIDARLGRSAADSQRVLVDLRQRMLEREDPEQRRELLIQGLATASDLSPALIAKIDGLWTSLMQQLAAPVSMPAPLPGGDVLLRLEKLARLLRFAQFPDAEAAWLCGRATDLGMPDLLALPVTSLDAPVAFSAFECFLDFRDARSAVRNRLEPLYQVIERAIDPAGSLTEVVRALANTTDWSEADIYWCLPAPLTVASDIVPDALRQPATYARMKHALGFARRLGAPAATVAAIVGRSNRPAPGSPDGLPKPPWTTARRAEELTRLVRAQREPAAWLALARPLNDRLRERRRDALSAYLIHVHPQGLPRSIRSAADLFAYFLVDVEMGACMRTSRIKHAVSTVQLFIQRCLMGLEGSDVRMEPSKAREWVEWRSIYRIWEANRKVFLYPENWLEPELRETRTPFFKELESEVNQAELTAESAERAVQGYLSKLEGVSNLEPVAIHRESRGQGEVLHVLARTTSLPHIHHYRYRTKLESSSPGAWSPWERVEMEIDSEHVILLVFQGRLRVYWAVIHDVASAPAVANDPPVISWDIAFFWSERYADRWARRQEIKVDGPRKLLAASGKSPNEAVALRALVFDNGIRIDCHIAALTDLPDPRPKKSPTDLADGQIAVAGASTVHGWVVDKVGVPIAGATVNMSWTETEFDPEIREWRVERESNFILSLTGYFDLPVPNVSGAGVDDDDEVKLYASYVDPAKKGTIKSPTKTITKSSHLRLSRSFVLSGVETLPAQPKVVVWLPAFSVMIDGNDRGLVSVPSMNALGTLGGTSVFGMGYRQDGSRDFQLLGFGIHSPRPGFILPAACLDSDDAEVDVYAYRDERAFLLFERNAEGSLITTTLGPTAASILRGRAAHDGLRRFFEAGYPPAALVGDMGSPIDVSFDRRAPEQAYYWEVFFHVPLLIATRFSRDRRFADARRWLHYIFDPTTSAGVGPERFWIARPFRELAATSPGVVRALLPTDPDELAEQVAAMRREPFRPHAIAALRIAAYMRTTFFRYMDVLIAWGDHLFRRETIESLNEATQLYVLAQAMLGTRSEKVPARALPAPQTFRSLIANKHLNSELWKAEVEIGDLAIPNLTALPPPTPSLGSVALFCFPTNSKLGKYHDTIQDRLYKVRHCKNIEGSALLLSLWDAPIDPDLLVRATAAGLDLQQFFDDLADGPLFRFNILIQKANELCSEVKSFGAALLSSLEKRDAEQLNRLRAHHEVELVGRVRSVKQAQLEEARRSKTALQKSLAVTDARGEHYAQLLRGARQALPGAGVEGGFEALAGTVGAPSMKAAEGTVMLEQESQEFQALDDAQRAQNTAADWELGAAIAHPFTATAGTPFFSMQANLGMAFSAVAGRYRADSARRGAESTRLSKQASLVLRAYDWALQLRLADRERAQIDAQILAAEIRETIAERELANHERQIEEVREVEQFLRDKYTNEQLYDWTIGGISKLYFASYRLAQGMARRAEAAYAREIGEEKSAIVGNDHWDGYYSGLLAGERLSQDLKRLEVAYLDRNAREFELTKHVSLLQLNPEALYTLKTKGDCHVELPEWLFDLDCPGHYFRRLKSVSLSIPAVVGPYTSVNCTLTLEKSYIRRDPNSSDNYAHGLRDDPSAAQCVVTSSGVNDSGLFETNLRDERYLPFEGRGAVSSWQLELPTAFEQFDHDSISDVILHVRYTARAGGEQLRDAANKNLKEMLAKDLLAGGAPRMRLVSLRHEFPSAWSRFSATGGPASRSELFVLPRTSFPFLYSRCDLTVVDVAKIPVTKDPSVVTSEAAVVVELQPPPGTAHIPDGGLAITVSAVQSIAESLKDYLLLISYTCQLSQLNGSQPGDGSQPNLGTGVLADKPIGYWRLGEPPGSAIAVDSSGRGNNGTYSSGGITLGQPGFHGTDTAALFDGATGRVVVPNSATLNPPRITMEAWVRWDGPTHMQQRILEKESYAGTAQYALSVQPDGQVLAELRMRVPGSPRVVSAKSSALVVLGAATHIVATYDGAAIRIYLNGTLDSTTAVTDPADIDTKWPHSPPDDLEVALAIGDRMGQLGPPPSQKTFKGLIDEVALFDVALTDKQIVAHYSYRPA